MQAVVCALRYENVMFSPMLGYACPERSRRATLIQPTLTGCGVLRIVQKCIDFGNL